jgi:prepilin-type N-terminal cleavage/methylation domain-containing protein/prepilin-type processing-associated H-X9-DG protein
MKTFKHSNAGAVPRRAAGFTLVELMVTIVIMAVLASIAFVVFQRARTKAQAVRCMSNLRQIGVLLNGAATENHGMYPHGGPPHGWISRLCTQSVSGYPTTGSADEKKYFESGAGEIFMCPSDKEGNRELHKSYLGNPYVLGMKQDDGEWLGNGTFKPKRLQSIRNPSQVFLVIEDWTRDTVLWRGNGLRYKGNLERDEENPVHDEGRHFLFVDGHIELLASDPGQDPEKFDRHYRDR